MASIGGDLRAVSLGGNLNSFFLSVIHKVFDGREMRSGGGEG